MIKRRLLVLLSKSKKYVVHQVLWQWFSLVCQIVLITTATTLLDRALYGGLDEDVWFYSILTIAVCIFLRVLCENRACRASYAAGVSVKRVLRGKIYEKLLRLGASYREQISTAEVVQMSAEGVEQLEIYFGKYLAQLAYSLLAPLTLFVVLLRIDTKAAIVLLVCVPLIPVSIVIVQKIAKLLLRKYWDAYAKLGDSFLENLQGMTTLKIYRADKQKAEEMDKEAQHFRKITMKVLTMQLNSTSVMDIVAYGGAALGIIVILQQFSAGEVDLAGTLTVVLLAAEFFIPLRLLGSYFHIAMNGMAASDKMFAFLDLPEPEEAKGSLRPDHQGMSVKMRSMGFAYEKNRDILSDVDVTFPAKSMVSIVGTSGCGKSTIAGILAGRNRGYRGSVQFVNHTGSESEELSELSGENIRRLVTMVTCNSYIFSGTVEENLRLGNPNAGSDDILHALELVNLKDFLVGGAGLKTKITEGGSNLSGGQRQRLAIARALLRDTPVYIFDEATSNIDMESEEMIMEVIRSLAETKTVILISHRLANVVDSACIYLLKDGCIAESGTHEALMKRGGQYHELYTRQLELEQFGKEVDGHGEQ